MTRPLRSELLFATLALFAVFPLWVVERPPFQDLPQHLAAIRVLADYEDPALAFERFFVLDLWRTQYIAYYLVTAALALPFGVTTANTLVLSVTLAATPYAMRSLLRSLGHDERLSVFTFPLLFNVHLMLGFLNFVAAIPLMLFGLGLSAKLRSRWRRREAIALAALALLLFLTHVVPFGLFALGTMALSLSTDWRATLVRLLPLLPAGLFSLLWGYASAAGRSTVEAAFGGGVSSPRAAFLPLGELLRQGPSWLTDILVGSIDEIVLVSCLVIAVALVVLRLRTRARSDLDPPEQDPGSTRHWRPRARLVWLFPLCVVLYFVLPAGYDWIWPINARFPILAAFFAVLLLPRAHGIVGRFALVGVGLLSALFFAATARAFIDVANREIGPLDEAIATIPKGQKVAGLIFERGSSAVRFSPYLHSVAWVQVERGGVVMFSFADFPQSPLHFRDADRPPPVRRRWEWGPEYVQPDRELIWYDYVLVRGGPGKIGRSRRFRPIFRGGRWRVYQRVGEGLPSPL